MRSIDVGLPKALRPGQWAQRAGESLLRTRAGGAIRQHGEGHQLLARPAGKAGVAPSPQCTWGAEPSRPLPVALLVASRMCRAFKLSAHVVARSHEWRVRFHQEHRESMAAFPPAIRVVLYALHRPTAVVFRLCWHSPRSAGSRLGIRVKRRVGTVCVRHGQYDQEFALTLIHDEPLHEYRSSRRLRGHVMANSHVMQIGGFRSPSCSRCCAAHTRGDRRLCDVWGCLRACTAPVRALSVVARFAPPCTRRLTARIGSAFMFAVPQLCILPARPAHELGSPRRRYHAHACHLLPPAV
jgi:hypothetical protein